MGDPEKTYTGREEASVETPFFKGKVKGDHLNLLLTFFSCVGSVLIAYMLFAHQHHAEKSSEQFVQAVKEQTQNQKEVVSVLREQTCLLSLDQVERKQEFSSPNGLCKRMSR